MPQSYAFDAQPVFVDMGGGTVVRYRRHADQRVARFVSKNGVNGVTVYLGPWEYHRRTGTTSYVKTVLHVDVPARVAQAEKVRSGSDPDSVAVFFVHGDHLGSAQALTDTSGGLLSQEEFFAYGRSSDRRDERNRYRYIGVERDVDTFLAVTGPRLLDLVTGRFLQRDPIATQFAGDGSYNYSSAKPLRRVDTSGYAPIGPRIPNQPELQGMTTAPASDMQTWATEVRRVLKDAGVVTDLQMHDQVLDRMKDIGANGRVFYAPNLTVEGQYDYTPDEIYLNPKRPFTNLKTASPNTPRIVFHEGFHATRQQEIAFVEADYALELSKATNKIELLEATIKYTQLSLREETLAHAADYSVFVSFKVEKGLMTPTEARKALADDDPTTGPSAADLVGELTDFAAQYRASIGGNVGIDRKRYVDDTRVWAKNSSFDTAPPDVRNYIVR